MVAALSASADKTILKVPAILGWALILSWLLDGAMWVRRKLHTAEEELDGLDQPEESENQVNVTCVTDDGVNEHVVPELVLSTQFSLRLIQDAQPIRFL